MKHSPAPVSVHLPAFLQGVTAGEVLLGAAVLIALLVIGRMARALGKLAAKASAPAPAPSGGGGFTRGKLVLLAAAAAGGWWLVEQHQHAAATARAGPVPAPAPSPTPTVTRIVPKNVPVLLHNWPVSGPEIVLIVVVVAVAAVVIVRLAGRFFS